MAGIKWDTKNTRGRKVSDADSRRAFKRFGGEMIKALAKYPRYQSPTYVRTGTEGRGWKQKFSDTGGRWEVEVTNDTPYASYVQGDKDQQARVMAGIGWLRVDDAADDIWPDIEGDVIAAINAAIDDLAG